MKKLLLYLVLAVVSSLSAFPQVAQATPYDCTLCRRSFDITNALYYFSVSGGGNGSWVYTEDPLYPLSDNNETAWNAVTWDVSNSISKPDWESVSGAYINDLGHTYKLEDDLAVNYYPLKEDVADAKLDITGLTADVVALESAVGALPSPSEFSDLETAIAGKMNTPAGTTSQYMRGDGSLATFPAQVQADWAQGSSGSADFIKNKPSLATVATSGAYTDLSGKPSLGTSAELNVAAAGNAASGEVVKGSDTRLTDSRTPTTHTHAAADITSGTKTSSFVSDFAEAAQDNVLGVVTAGSGLSYTYNDAGNAASISLASKTYQSPTFNSSTTAAQLSTTVEADVFYAFDATVTISLLAGQSVTATLKYADNSGMSTNVVTVDSATTSNSGVLNLTQTNTLRIGGKIPAGKYRQVTFAVTGSGAAAPTTIKAGQEAF